jgi:hypothetical protein
MSSKHTKRGRHARRRAHHVEVAREAMVAHEGRRLRAKLDREAPPVWLNARAMMGIASW